MFLWSSGSASALIGKIGRVSSMEARDRFNAAVLLGKAEQSLPIGIQISSVEASVFTVFPRQDGALKLNRADATRNALRPSQCPPQCQTNP